LDQVVDLTQAESSVESSSTQQLNSSMEQLTTRAVCYVTSVSLCAAAQSSGANAKFWASLEQRAVDVLEKVSSAC